MAQLTVSSIKNSAGNGLEMTHIGAKPSNGSLHQMPLGTSLVAGLQKSEILEQLARILASERFRNSPRLQKFLSFVVEESVEGNAADIKGPLVAFHVYEISDMDEAHNTSVVRVEAGRLRKSLDRYYRSQGLGDPITITIPKGTYAPEFTPREGSTTKSFAPKFQNRGAWTIGITSAVILVLVSFILRDGEPNLESEPANDAIQIENISPTLAVLPFRGENVDVEIQSLATQLSEDISENLAALSNLNVIAPASALRIEQLESDYSLLQSRYGISHLLTGSLDKSGDHYLLSAALVRLADGQTIWADEFDRVASGLLGAQATITSAVVGGLAIELDTTQQSRLEDRRQWHPEIRALYKQGMDIANPPTDPRRLELAMSVFENLMILEEQYPGGFAGKAYALSFYAWWGHSAAPQQDAEMAMELAGTALSLDLDNGLAHMARAFAHMSRGRFNQALEQSWNAVNLKPNDPYLLSYHAFLLSKQNESEASLEYARKAVRLDPVSVRTPFRNILAVVLIHAGRYQEAVDVYGENTRRGDPLSRPQMVYRAAALAATGREDEARATLAEADRYPPFNWKSWLARTYANDTVKGRLLKPLSEVDYALD